MFVVFTCERLLVAGHSVNAQTLYGRQRIVHLIFFQDVIKGTPRRIDILAREPLGIARGNPYLEIHIITSQWHFCVLIIAEPALGF